MRGKPVKIGVILLVALVQVGTTNGAFAQAGYYCSEPIPPSCVDSFETFDDEWSFQRCQQEIENYVNEASSFRTCLAEWHDAAGAEVDRVIDRFNCKASGNNFC